MKHALYCGHCGTLCELPDAEFDRDAVIDAFAQAHCRHLDSFEEIHVVEIETRAGLLN